MIVRFACLVIRGTYWSAKWLQRQPRNVSYESITDWSPSQKTRRPLSRARASPQRFKGRQMMPQGQTISLTMKPKFVWQFILVPAVVASSTTMKLRRVSIGVETLSRLNITTVGVSVTVGWIATVIHRSRIAVTAALVVRSIVMHVTDANMQTTRTIVNPVWATRGCLWRVRQASKSKCGNGTE